MNTSKTTLSNTDVARRLSERFSFARAGSELFVYIDGVYQPGGEDFVKATITTMPDVQWSTSRANEVSSYLLVTAPRLEGRPSLHEVNLLNGVLNLETGKLEQHRSTLLSPIQIDARYDLSAKCPAIEKFVREVFPADAGALAYEIAGYLLTPDTRAETAVLLLGRGANGKSTYLHLLRSLLGEGNVSSTALQVLDNNRFAAANLYGKLANINADLDADGLRKCGTFKAIVSGDAITAEYKYGKPFTFRPYARLIFSANEAPPTTDISEAFAGDG